MSATTVRAADQPAGSTTADSVLIDLEDTWDSLQQTRSALLKVMDSASDPWEQAKAAAALVRLCNTTCALSPEEEPDRSLPPKEFDQQYLDRIIARDLEAKKAAVLACLPYVVGLPDTQQEWLPVMELRYHLAACLFEVAHLSKTPGHLDGLTTGPITAIDFLSAADVTARAPGGSAPALSPSYRSVEPVWLMESVISHESPELLPAEKLADLSTEARQQALTQAQASFESIKEKASLDIVHWSRPTQDATHELYITEISRLAQTYPDNDILQAQAQGCLKMFVRE